MGIFDRIGDWFSRIEWGGGDGSSFRNSSHDHSQINPATGLPMTGSGMGGVDVGGNPFGTDLHRWHDDSASRSFHDSSSTNWHHTTASGGYDPSRGW